MTTIFVCIETNLLKFKIRIMRVMLLHSALNSKRIFRLVTLVPKYIIVFYAI